MTQRISVRLFVVKVVFVIKSFISNIANLTCILEKKPKLRELVSLLTDIEYEWDKIGIALEVEDRVLGGLTRSHDDNKAKLITVLRSWMDTFSSKSTWDVVIAAVEGPIVNRPSIASKIRQFLAKPEVQLKYEVN